jgi:hypothetical protein
MGLYHLGAEPKRNENSPRIPSRFERNGTGRSLCATRFVGDGREERSTRTQGVRKRQCVLTGSNTGEGKEPAENVCVNYPGLPSKGMIAEDVLARFVKSTVKNGNLLTQCLSLTLNPRFRGGGTGLFRKERVNRPQTGAMRLMASGAAQPEYVVHEGRAHGS